MERILVVAAHPDDEVLGCGATTAKLRAQGKAVNVLILGRGRGDTLDQRFDTVPLIDWIVPVEACVAQFQPDTVFTHSATDLNEDHAITHKAVLAACRPPSGVKEIYAFEVLSCTEWSRPAFDPDTWVDVSGVPMTSKYTPMMNEYKAELREWPHPRSIPGISALAMYRGMQIGVEFAEAFKTIRRVL